jgi:hypothetical protein
MAEVYLEGNVEKYSALSRQQSVSYSALDISLASFDNPSERH